MTPPRSNRCVLVTALLLVSCGDSSQPVAPLPPSPTPVVTMLANPAGEGQEGIAGYQLPLPIRVEVRGDGAPLQGVVVNWSTSSGSVTPTAVVTDVNGIASAEWTLGLASGPVTATAQITQPAIKTLTFTANAIDEVNVEAVTATQFQSAEVGTALPQPIRLRVTKNGLPRAGVPVKWTVVGGSITENTITGSDGIASAIWTLPPTPGAGVARATVRGDRSGTWTFQGTALIGPPAQLAIVEGNAQALPPYADAFKPLTVAVRDRFGNGIAGVAVEWAVEQGPVELLHVPERTGPNGRSSAIVMGIAGGGGTAVVRAQLGMALTTRFTLAVDPPQDVIFLDTYRNVFVSGRNRSSPAVDTVAVGALVKWQLSLFDYDAHAIASVGTPALPSGTVDFPYANPSTTWILFTQPGTYRYIDPYTGATGTLVVQ